MFAPLSGRPPRSPVKILVSTMQAGPLFTNGASPSNMSEAPISGRSWALVGNVPPISPDVGRNRIPTAQPASKKHHRPKFGRIRATCGQHRATFGRTRSALARNEALTMLAGVAPRIGPYRANCGRVSSGRVPPPPW